MSKTPDEIMEKHGWIYNPFSKDLVHNMLEEYADQRVSEALNSQWVSVKERKPDEGTWCLVCADAIRPIVLSGCLYFTVGLFCKAGNTGWEPYVKEIITHWQPLPSPPLNH